MIYINIYLFYSYVMKGFRNVNIDLYRDALNSYLLEKICTTFPYFLSGNLNGSMHF